MRSGLRFRDLAGESPTHLSFRLSMAQSRRRRSFTFQFRRGGENVHTHTRTRRSRARYERGRSDRAIAQSTVTHAYTFGPRSSPSGPPPRLPPSRVLSLYIEIALPPYPRFRIPSSTLSGEALLLLPSMPAPSLWTTCLGARFNIPRQCRNLAHVRGIKFCEIFCGEMIKAEMLRFFLKKL